MTFGVVGSTMLLSSGRYFDLLVPQPEQFVLGDIASALSKLCRFGGHVPQFYSVAEHCCHCADAAAADKLSRQVQIACLLHDAAEAFIGDVIKPLKQLLDPLHQIESRIEQVIAAKYRVTSDLYALECVRRIDREMLIAERMNLFGDDGVKWVGQDQVARRHLRPELWAPRQAEAQFMARAESLGLLALEGGAEMPPNA